MKILLVGSYPPPIGGNTVHIKRLVQYFSDRGSEVQVLDYLTSGGVEKDPHVVTLPPDIMKKVRLLLSFPLTTSRETIVHFHVSAMGKFKWIAPFLIALFWRQPRLLTIHSGSFIRETNSGFVRKYLGVLLRFFHKIIAVNDSQKKFISDLGISKSRIHVIPAFLPQVPEKKIVPKEVLALRSYKNMVLTSGYLTPLYNYEVIIDCIAHLGSAYAFVFAFYNVFEPQYEQKIYNRLKDFDNVVVLRDQSPEVFVSVLDLCDIYVRATLSDGDAVAVREALQFGKVVFATDSVKRPEGCHLFPPHASDKLLQLFHTRFSTGSIGQHEEHSGQKLLELYQELL